MNCYCLIMNKNELLMIGYEVEWYITVWIYSSLLRLLILTFPHLTVYKVNLAALDGFLALY